MRKVTTEEKNEKWKIMTFIVATNIVASGPPARRPTGTPHTLANTKLYRGENFPTNIPTYSDSTNIKCRMTTVQQAKVYVMNLSAVLATSLFIFNYQSFSCKQLIKIHCFYHQKFNTDTLQFQAKNTYKNEKYLRLNFGNC